MAKRTWRSIGANGEPYPDWLRALAHRSGVYAIRVPGIFSPTVVYVGESHTGRLAKTIARHFQHWKRAKGFWSEVFGKDSDTDPGRTYPRAEAEVCVQTCDPSRALALQNAWIAELRPRDNILGAPDDVVPF